MASFNATLQVERFARQTVQIHQDDKVHFDGPVRDEKMISIQAKTQLCETPFLDLDVQDTNVKSALDCGLSKNAEALGGC